MIGCARDGARNALAAQGERKNRKARVQQIGFLGTYNDAGAKVDAMALLGEQSIRYDATLRLLTAERVAGAEWPH